MKNSIKTQVSSIKFIKFNFVQSLFLIINFSFLIVITSCVDKINIQPQSTYTRLVVEAYFTNDTTRHMVRLSKSGDALNHNPVAYISNAQVSITDNIHTFNLHEDSVNKGTYYTDPNVYGIPGNTYTLNISNVDLNGDGKKQSFTATSIMKKEAPVDSIWIKYDKISDYEQGWIVYLFAQDVGGGRNFYLIKMYKNNILLTDSAQELTAVTDNTGFEGGYYNGFYAYYLNYHKPDERVRQGDKLTLEMDGITQEYYQFIMDYIQEYYPKIPIFSGPSANISTNIQPKDNAVGFFAVYSTSRKSRIYK